MSTAPNLGKNLLEFRWVRAIMRSPLFPYLFQAMILAFFVWLAVSGWGHSAPEGIDGKLYAKTSLINLLVWGLWWPAMVWGAVLLGRVWCAVCPLELVANVTERLGRATGIRQRILGKWLRSGALILAIYAIIQMLVAGVHLHRVPAYTSIFLWSLLATAVVVGFGFKDRAFCRGFCPVGLLLGTYGRGAMLAVRPVSGEKCSDCATKQCTLADNRDHLDGRSCPSLLNPARVNTNSDCLVCGQCIKVCRPMDNMGLFLRRPFHPADAREKLPSWPTTLFVMLVSGFVAYELCSEWASAKAVFLSVPTTLAESLGLAAFAEWVKGIWMLFVFPLLLWLVLGVLATLCRGAGSLMEAWKRLALPLAVVIAAGHMAKGLAKIASWGSYLPYALSDPISRETASAMTAGTIAKPSALLPMSSVSAAGAGLVLVMGCFALRESRLADPATHWGRVPAIVVFGAVWVFLVFGWGFVQ